jgi:hypothetical protein
MDNYPSMGDEWLSEKTYTGQNGHFVNPGQKFWAGYIFIACRML